MRLITSSTLTNQDISPATVGTTGLLIYTYTADADRNIFFRIFLDQIAGNGSYKWIRTLQRAGAGTVYRGVNNSFAVESGVTVGMVIQNDFPILNTDVLKLYLIGLAGDTTTPDVVTEIWEQDYLRPITAGQFLTYVDANGRMDLGKWVGVAPSALNSGLVQSDVERWLNTAPATPTTSGVPEVDVTFWLGSPPSTPNAAGIPLVDLEQWRGTVPAALSSTLVQVLDSAGVTTLLSRLTGTRAGLLDNLTFLDSLTSAIKTVIDAVKLKTDNLPSDPADESLLIAAISAGTATVTTQTDLIKAKTTNLPASPAATGAQMDLVNSPNATAIGNIQSGLAMASALSTLTNRIGAFTGTGVNTLLGFLRAMLRSDLTAPSDVGGTFDPATDSTQAIRDRGDAAWVTGSGGDSAATIADAVWDETRAGHVAAGSFGQGVASVQGNVTGNVAGSVASVTGNVGGNIGGTVPDSTGVTTLLARFTATRAAFIDNLAVLAGWTGTLLTTLQAIARKDATSVDLGGTYDEVTDSLEAEREKIDTLAVVTPITQNEDITES